MAQGSKPRHSRSTRKPVTIDLEPGAVSEKKTESGEPEKAGDAASETASPETAAKARTADAKADDNRKAADIRGNKDTTAAAKTTSDEAKARTSAAPEAPKASNGRSDHKKQDDDGARKTTTRSVPASEPAQRPSGGSGTTIKTLAAAIAAAIIAVALVGGLQWSGILPVPGGGTSGGNILAADVDALKRSVATLESNVSDTAGVASDALTNRVAALEASLPAAAGSDDNDNRLTDLESKLTALESRLSSISSGSDDAALADVGQKVTAVEDSLSGQQTTLQQLQTSISDLDNRISTNLQNRGQSIQDVETRLAAIEKRLDAPRQDLRVAQALAAASLKAAIDRGGSFMAELEAYASIDGDNPAVAQLQTLAADGVPSRATLLARFPSVANAMIDAGEAGTTTGGVFDRLWNSATSLVRVRPVGEVTGDSVEAIVARMETDLQGGDLQGAVDEWNTLPQASKDVSQDYVADLKARIEAERLVSSTVAAAQAGTAQTGSSAPDGSTATGEQN